jgi:hypothetical protein
MSRTTFFFDFKHFLPTTDLVSAYHTGVGGLIDGAGYVTLGILSKHCNRDTVVVITSLQ